MKHLTELNDFYSALDEPLTCARHAAVPAAWNRNRLEPEAKWTYDALGSTGPV